MRELVAAPADPAASPAAPLTHPVPPTASPRRPAGWDLLLVCVAIYIVTSVGRVHQLFPVLAALKPTFVAAMLAIVLYAFHQSGPRRVGRLRSGMTTCLLGLLVCAGLSVATALNQGLAFTWWTALARSIAMCLVVAGCVRTVRDLERLVLAYFGATVVFTAIVLSRFQLGANDWRLANLLHYDANDLATLITTAMPFGLYFVLAQRRLLLRLLAGGGLAVLAVGLVRSGSRGGFLAFLAVVVYVLIGFTTIPARSRLAGLIVLLVVAFATASDRYWTQMKTIINPKGDYNLTEEGGRIKIWKRGLAYMADRPLAGVGVMNFPRAEGTLSSATMGRWRERGKARWGAAHNSFIQIGAETGIPGLLFFIGVIATGVAALRRVTRKALKLSPPARNVSRLAQSLTAALIAFVVGAFFLSLAYADMLYALVGFVIALQKIGLPDRKIARPILSMPDGAAQSS